MIPQTRRPLIWLLLAILMAYVAYMSFRGYLSPEFLIGYANLFAC